MDDFGDDLPGDGVCATFQGQCTLRAAVEEANVLAGGPHTIEMAVLGAGPYQVVDTPSIDILADMIIRGTGGRPVIVGGGFLSGAMLRVGNSASVQVEGLELRANDQSAFLIDDVGADVTLDDMVLIPGTGGQGYGLEIFDGAATCTRCVVRDASDSTVCMSSAASCA